MELPQHSLGRWRTGHWHCLGRSENACGRVKLSGKFVPYTQTMSSLIEESYRRHDTEAHVTIEGRSYIVVLTAPMHQRLASDPSRRRDVHRINNYDVKPAIPVIELSDDDEPAVASASPKKPVAAGRVHASDTAASSPSEMGKRKADDADSVPTLSQMTLHQIDDWLSSDRFMGPGAAGPSSPSSCSTAKAPPPPKQQGRAGVALPRLRDPARPVALHQWKQISRPKVAARGAPTTLS